jgi:hypothetical protein
MEMRRRERGAGDVGGVRFWIDVERAWEVEERAGMYMEKLMSKTLPQVLSELELEEHEVKTRFLSLLIEDVSSSLRLSVQDVIGALESAKMELVMFVKKVCDEIMESEVRRGGAKNVR